MALPPRGMVVLPNFQYISSYLFLYESIAFCIAVILFL
jgi:hypothetical protein